MKTFTKRRMLFVLTSLVLIAVMALMLCSCTNNKETTQPTETQASSVKQEAISIGEGATSFTFMCVFEDGSEKVYTVNTDKKNVGEALLDNNLIAGEQSDYGLYVKTVCDVVADYDTNGAYWAFYEGEKMASSGADLTEIKPGVEYSFRYTK